MRIELKGKRFLLYSVRVQSIFVQNLLFVIVVDEHRCVQYQVNVYVDDHTFVEVRRLPVKDK